LLGDDFGWKNQVANDRQYILDNGHAQFSVSQHLPFDFDSVDLWKWEKSKVKIGEGYIFIEK